MAKRPEKGQQPVSWKRHLRNRVTEKDYMKSLCESDLDRIISFVMGIVSTGGQSKEKPNCPYCGNSHVIKYSHRKVKQRFLCHNCRKIFMHSTNTLLANFHSSQSIWVDFIHNYMKSGNEAVVYISKYKNSYGCDMVIDTLLENMDYKIEKLYEGDFSAAYLIERNCSVLEDAVTAY